MRALSEPQATSRAVRVSRLQNHVGRGGLTVRPDQVILQMTILQALCEEWRDGRTFGDFNSIGEPVIVIPDKVNLHRDLSESGKFNEPGPENDMEQFILRGVDYAAYSNRE